jgi:hypothetical protein
MTLSADPYPGEPATTTAGRRQLGSFATYSEAQHLVDRLSDSGFDVSAVTIVGSDLRTVEQVTGRLTTARAALYGAGAGAWWGLFVGLLLGLFTTAFWGPLLTGLLVGVLFGALSGAVAHAATRGKRDFSSVQGLQAGRYEVLVTEQLAADAERALARR